MIITEYNEEWDNAAHYEQGFKDGFEQGFKEGFEQGFKEGIKQGREEIKLNIVKNLLAVQTPIEYIIAATNWSEEQILKHSKN